MKDGALSKGIFNLRLVVHEGLLVSVRYRRLKHVLLVGCAIFNRAKIVFRLLPRFPIDHLAHQQPFALLFQSSELTLVEYLGREHFSPLAADLLVRYVVQVHHDIVVSLQILIGHLVEVVDVIVTGMGKEAKAFWGLLRRAFPPLRSWLCWKPALRAILESTELVLVHLDVARSLDVLRLSVELKIALVLLVLYLFLLSEVVFRKKIFKVSADSFAQWHFDLDSFAILLLLEPRFNPF